MSKPGSAGRILAVCVATEDVRLPRVGASAIDKRPQPDRVRVGELGPETDHVCDTRHHGGVDQAVYAYDDAEAKRWADELDRDLPFGWFGENLRLRGLPVTDAVVGERWRIGDDGLVVEVTIPRIPCRTFAVWCGEPNWVKRFLDRGDTGAYLRVCHTGTVGADDEVTVVHRPEHGVRVRDLLGGAAPDDLRTLLAGDDVAPKVRRDAERLLRRS